MKEEQVMHPKMLYTLKEVAQIIGSNEPYVQNLRKAGLLKCIQLGRYKVRHEELERFLRENEGMDLRDPFNVKPITENTEALKSSPGIRPRELTEE